MKRRRDAVTHSEAILRSMHVFAPSLVEEVLHSEGGYVSSCEAVQKTKGVCFPFAHVMREDVVAPDLC